jgi:hypothetical membrane protein
MSEAVLQIDSRQRTLVGMESEAIIVGGVAAGIGGVFGAIVFAGTNPPIWGGFSLGLAAAIAVLVLGVITSYVGYWRSRYIPGQEWRLTLKPWKFIVDATAVAGVHAIVAAITTIAIFILLQMSFQGLHVDGWTSTFGLAATTGLATYYIYLSVSRINTSKMAALLVVFMVVAVLTSMATAQDPLWWEYHFSQLGTFEDRSSGLFNITLIIAGGLVTTFALYLYRDIQVLVDKKILDKPWAPRAISVTFIVMGIFLACVGLFPVHTNPTMHNVTAIGMAIAFILLLSTSRWTLKGMSWTFFVVTFAFLAGVLISVYLFAVTHYFNLTAFELVVFAIIFGWISTFIRFISATVDQSNATVKVPPAA